MTQNKIVVITGGSRGLGKNMALNLAKKGLDIILTYNSKNEEALMVVKEIESLGQKAIALQLDISDTKNFDYFFKEVSSTLKEKFNTNHFDFLVNNAGVGMHALIADTTEAQFDSVVNIHFKSTFFLTQKALALMADGGGIVNLSSGLTRFSMPGASVYASMKGAVETLTKYMAKELGTRKIRVNVVAPGAIETDFGGGMVRDNAELNKQIANGTALGRVGLPDDVGSVVAFFCTPWINGQRIEVSG